MAKVNEKMSDFRRWDGSFDHDSALVWHYREETARWKAEDEAREPERKRLQAIEDAETNRRFFERYNAKRVLREMGMLK